MLQILLIIAGVLLVAGAIYFGSDPLGQNDGSMLLGYTCLLAVGAGVVLIIAAIVWLIIAWLLS